MDPQPSAPPVVVVVVATDALARVDETLASIAAQDYPELSVLVLDAGGVRSLARVAEVMPSAYVRRVDADSGFAALANAVIGSVDGAAYYVFCHDDISFDPDAVRLMVEEGLRSNAGVVGPKMVEWGRPEYLLEVGLAVDKTGVATSLVDRGELDQEQHDAVRDVFAVSDGCLLVRHDLFAALGGFDTAMGDHIADIDLCWRAQVAGARVIVAPAARVQRRVEAPPEPVRGAHGRRAHRLGVHGAASEAARTASASAARDEKAREADRLRARHRLRAVLKNYSVLHRVRVLPQAAIVAVAEVIVAVVGGRLYDVGRVASAWSWNLRHRRELRPLRRAVKATRTVPDSEVRRLQRRGSTRLASYLRGQLHAEDQAQALLTGWRQLTASLSSGVAKAALALLVVMILVPVIGSRHLLSGRLPAVGQLAPFPGPGALFGQFVSSRRSVGLGSGAQGPTAFGLLGMAGVVMLGHMALLRRVLTLGALPVGAWGAWRLGRPLGSTLARMVLVIVYLSVPVPYDALSRGRWSGLLMYAAAPWLLGRLARLSGLEPFDGAIKSSRWRQILSLALLVALVSAFVPAAGLALLVAAVGVVLGSVLVGGTRPAARTLVTCLAAVAVSLLLLLPWSIELLLPAGWAGFTGVAPAAAGAPTLSDLLRFHVGPVGVAPLGWAFLVAAGLSLVMGRGWRLAWAARCWSISLVSVLVAWAGARGWFPVRLQSPDVLLAMAAAAFALAAALGAVAFISDLSAYRFGWRHAASALAASAVVVGVFPIVGAAGGGRWRLPTDDLSRSLSWMRAEVSHGSFRVLWVGDPDVLPLDGWRLGDGLAYGTSRNGPPDVIDLWPGPPRSATRAASALKAARRGDTARVGGRLAPLGIRYLVLPERQSATDGAVRRPLPATWTHALLAQIDLRALPAGPGFTLYENTAWRRGAAPSGPGGAAHPGTAQAVTRYAGVAIQLALWVAALAAVRPPRRSRHKDPVPPMPPPPPPRRDDQGPGRPGGPSGADGPEPWYRSNSSISAGSKLGNPL